MKSYASIGTPLLVGLIILKLFEKSLKLNENETIEHLKNNEESNTETINEIYYFSNDLTQF